mgnify:CR=1 FL=1
MIDLCHTAMDIIMAIISLVLIAVLTAVDQLIKYLVVNNLKPVGSVMLIPNLLEFRYLENSGASFGMLQGFAWAFAAMTVVISAVIIYLLFKYKHHNFFTYSAAVLIVAGGIGNLIDRIFYGYVVDFIHVMFFDYIFNFADCMVVTGVILFLIHIIFFMDKPQKKDAAGDGGKEN